MRPSANNPINRIRKPETVAALQGACAKYGKDCDELYEAATAGTRNQVRVAQNEVRRMTNDTSDTYRKAIPTADEETLQRFGTEITALGDMMAALNMRTEMHDTFDDTRYLSDDKGASALHTPEQIRAHYEEKSRGEERLSMGDFFRGVAGMTTTREVKNALSIGTNSQGGFTVPSIVMGDILSALVPQSSLLTAGAGIVPLQEGAKTFTTAAIESVPTAAWRQENGNVAESDPVFRGIVAAPQSLAFFFRVSRELLADSPNIQSALLTAITQSFARELDRAGLRGTGTLPEPRGIANTAGIQAVGNGANGAALAGYANLFTAYQRLLEANAPVPTAAIMSPRSLIKLGGLLDTTNQPLNIPSMLQPMRMLSTSQIPNNLTVGTSTDCSEIYVGDFSKLVFMLRENVSVQLVDQAFATQGQVGFVCHVRADVALLYPAAFALVTGVRP